MGCARSWTCCERADAIRADSGADVPDEIRTRFNSLAVRAAKNYMITGRWSADWDEIRSVSGDPGCYDPGNFAKAMREAKGGILKGVDVGESVAVSPEGINQPNCGQAGLKDLAVFPLSPFSFELGKA